jgi:hypothetical protein
MQTSGEWHGWSSSAFSNRMRSRRPEASGLAHVRDVPHELQITLAPQFLALTLMLDLA